MKITLICEEDSIRGSGTKVTHEFTAYEAGTAIRKFEKFLRGSDLFFTGKYEISADTEKFKIVADEEDTIKIFGQEYTFDDQIDDFRSSSVFKHMADDLQKNPGKMSKDDEIQISINEFNFDNMSNMGQDHITGGDGIDIISSVNLDDIKIELSSPDTCPVCYLPKDVMMKHKCWDQRCPFSNDQSVSEHSLR
jgi:hypothetical protein